MLGTTVLRGLSVVGRMSEAYNGLLADFTLLVKGASEQSPVNLRFSVCLNPFANIGYKPCF